MPLILAIENADRLADGGPLRVEVDSRGLDIGRDQHLDWTLPDPSRYISGKHCEVRFYDNAYWLHDVSSNGTFVNGADYRLQGPHRLRNGDRLTIGQYVIGVTISGDGTGAEAVPMPPAPTAAPGDPWGGGDGVAPPVERHVMVDAQRKPGQPDFLDWAVAVGPPRRDDPMPALEPRARAAPATPDWLQDAALPALAPQAEPAPMPAPRRPSVEGPSVAPQPTIAPQPTTAPAPAPAPRSDHGDAVLARIAQAAGLRPDALSGRDPAKTADEIGLFMRLVAHNLTQMLASRAETKSLIRSSSRTMIRPRENNPLKFAPSPEEALRIMFTGSGSDYLDARATIEMSFSDLKSHQIHTFSAMQMALEALFQDLSPDQIEEEAQEERGLAALVGSRKGRLWEIYVQRWHAKSGRKDGRLVETFMQLFAEAYDRLQGRPR
jgi:type VI secretion system protein ImpI